MPALHALSTDVVKNHLSAGLLLFTYHSCSVLTHEEHIYKDLPYYTQHPYLQS